MIKSHNFPSKTSPLSTYHHPMSLTHQNIRHLSQRITLLLSTINFSLQKSPFSTTQSQFLVAARRSPTVRATQRERQRTGRATPGVIPPSWAPGFQSTPWPTQLLKEAAQSGQLSMLAQVAESVLDDFARSGTPFVGDICSSMLRDFSMRLNFFFLKKEENISFLASPDHLCRT